MKVLSATSSSCYFSEFYLEALSISPSLSLSLPLPPQLDSEEDFPEDAEEEEDDLRDVHVPY